MPSRESNLSGPGTGAIPFTVPGKWIQKALISYDRECGVRKKLLRLLQQHTPELPADE
jgi:hypothetical protein